MTSLEKNTSLVLLSISSVGMAIEGSWALKECLLKKPYLQKLFMDGNLIGPEGGVYVAEGLWNSRQLINLHMANCNIGKEGAWTLALAIS